MGFFALLREFGWRVAKSVEFYGLVGIDLAFGAVWLAGKPAPPPSVFVAVLVVASLLGAFSVFREERMMRAERDEAVRLTARLGSLVANSPDPGPDKESLRVHVFWEIWVAHDVATESLALNLTYEYPRRWRRLRRRRRERITGIPRKATGTTEYRASIRASDPQPFKADAEFEYVADREESADPHWLLDLVLVTGVPRGRYHVPVFIDLEEMRRRGTYPPL